MFLKYDLLVLSFVSCKARLAGKYKRCLVYGSKQRGELHRYSNKPNTNRDHSAESAAAVQRIQLQGDNTTSPNLTGPDSHVSAR
jgi:hypothetical protein